jgi:DNA repair protein RecN (Recombination protein N)
VLLRLVIQNLALIEHAELEPSPGLSVFTGETGAGKTMLAQAIGLLAGGQPGSALVGPHAEEAYVEAEFELPDGLLDDPALAPVADLRPEGEQTLVVARRVFASGRTRALVWGRSCARADLEALGDRLLELSSQHEAQRIAKPAVQLALLDGHAGNGERLVAMAAAWAGLRAARLAVATAREDAEQAERRRGELEYLVERVDAAEVVVQEREQIAAERERLRHLDELAAAITGALDLLSPDEGEGAEMLVARAAQLVTGGEAFEPALTAVSAELRDAALRLQESVATLRGHTADLEADPGRLEEIEQRLELFAELERRFGAPLERVLELAAEARTALAMLEQSGDAMAQLEAAEQAAGEQAATIAGDLHDARAAAVEAFTAVVEQELADLGMDGARLVVELTEAPLGARGSDRCELLLAANTGLDPAPLASTASGGELSRIALAIRVAARAPGGPGTLVLDEVDAGVGGRTARAVGEKLLRLAEHAQVISITHLPQIASLADAHFRVEKVAGDPTQTTVERLRGEALTDELARMLGGDDDDLTVRRHAKALRKSPQRA